MDEAERQNITHAIRAFLARERISREEFARRTRLGKSTVDKLVIGIFSEKTVLQVETHTKLKLLKASATHDIAAEDFGKYNRADVAQYFGIYTFARPSFHDDGVIHAFAMEIVWDDTGPCLLVRECTSGSAEPAQLGRVSIPRSSMHIFIMSNERGWVKQAILSQIDVYRTMKGIMLTMGHVFGNVYSPVALPVFMQKRESVEGVMHGQIAPGHELYDEYRRVLASIESENFARWIPAATGEGCHTDRIPPAASRTDTKRPAET